MAAVKTAISLDKALFEQVEDLARQMKTSRSKLVAQALEEFIRRRRFKELQDQLNEAYAEGPDAEDQALMEFMRRKRRQVLNNEW